MIGQFSGLYFTGQPAEFRSLFEMKSFSSIWPQRYIYKYLINLIFSVCTVNYGTSFFVHSDLSEF